MNNLLHVYNSVIQNKPECTAALRYADISDIRCFSRCTKSLTSAVGQNVNSLSCNSAFLLGCVLLIL